MRFRQAILKLNNKTYSLMMGRANSFDEIYVDFQNQPENGGERWTIFLHPKQDLTIQRLEIQFDLHLPPDARFFANGFQSQSESRLYSLNEAIPQLRFFVKKWLGFYGDEHISGIPHSRGYLHSWTYTYVRRNSEQSSDVQFFGSLNESTGFTLFLYDQPSGILTARKDMDGLRLSHSFPALDFWMGEGSEREVFNRYFQMLEAPPLAAAATLGWASEGEISEEIILQNLESVANSNLPFSFFQIGDGWQTAIGDWLSVKNAFPNGMEFLAKKIRKNDLLPALWLAPFVAAKDSDLAKRYPDWLLKNAKGKLLKIDKCYVLDFYNNEVRNYLGGVFHAILDRWGFEMVNLDWLFAVCLAPPPGKTRGQVMHEAMEFLRKLVGTKKMLACGVPLGAVFGLADYCRIGGDMHFSWEQRLLALLRFRERGGALSSLHSTLGRWQLNNRAFCSAPDIFVLENENQKLSLEQQQTLLTINALLGNLLFTSDDLSKYSPEQTAELEAALELRGSLILRVFEVEKDVWKIDFENDREVYSAFCNLTSQMCILRTGKENGQIELQPFETLILKLPLLMEGAGGRL